MNANPDVTSGLFFYSEIWRCVLDEVRMYFVAWEAMWRLICFFKNFHPEPLFRNFSLPKASSLMR